jgi:hypothetical protein
LVMGWRPMCLEACMYLWRFAYHSRWLLGIVLLCMALLPQQPAGAADSGVIATLLGSWGGSGRISYTDGTAERVQCTANYTGGGNELHMAIQCRSDSNTIHIRSKLKIDGARASGEWEERTFNVTGSATGAVKSNAISLSFSSGGFTGSMSVSFSHASQTISISTLGIAMNRATMSLARR